MDLKEFLYLPYMFQKLKEYPVCEFNFETNIPAKKITPTYNTKGLTLLLHEAQRESSRVLNNSKINQEDVLSLIQLSYGFISPEHRVVPSAGSYYPLSIYALQIDSNQIITNLFVFSPQENIMHKVSLRENGISISELLDVYHVDFSSAQWAILWASNNMPIVSKYGLKGLHFISIEVGHSAQMFILGCMQKMYKHITLGGIKEKEIITRVLPHGRKFLPQYMLLI